MNPARLHLIMFLGCALLLVGRVPAIQYSGDANQDSKLDIADAVKLTNITHSTATLTGLANLFADANQDGVIDVKDVQYVVDVLLGKSVPKPLGGLGLSAIASYWLQAAGLTAADAKAANTKPGAASYWFKQPNVTAADVQAANTKPGATSYWFKQPDVTAANANQTNVRLGVASYWFKSPDLTAAAANQTNVRPGVASYWFKSPALTAVDANETNVFQQQAPSYRRQ